MPRSLAVSKLYVRVWWRTFTSNPWAVACGVAALILTDGLLYLEAGPAMLGAGSTGILFVYRVALLGSFMTFALLDSKVFRSGKLPGFPSWVPATEREYILGVSLPAVTLIATLTTFLAVAVLIRALTSSLSFLLAVCALLANVLIASALGLAGGMAASSLTHSWGHRFVLPRVGGKTVLLLAMVALFGVALSLPSMGWDRWFRTDVAMAGLLTEGAARGIAPAITAAATFALLTWLTWRGAGALSLRYPAEVETYEAGATHSSLTFPRNHVLAIAMLESLRIARDRSTVWYMATVYLFFLGLTGFVGREVLVLQHGPAFLLMTFYMVVFLFATIPLRSVGRDLPLKWFWSSLPLHRSTYTLAKYLLATLLPSILLLSFLALALLAGGLKIEQGPGGWLDVFSFGSVAYGLAFVWGTFQPYRQGDLSLEFSQVGGFSVSAFLVFRALAALQPLIGEAQLVPALCMLTLLFGLSLALQEKRNEAL